MSANPIIIRNIGPEDVHLLDRVRPGTFANDVDPARAWAFLATRVNEMVVALEQGEVVGFASGTVLLHPDRATSFLVQNIRVHSEFRGRGIARRLSARLFELARDRGCETIRFVVDAGDAAGIEFLKKIGGTGFDAHFLAVWTDGSE